jgi:peptidoglycan/xylan/chitin deacetylase (PgdA/CDA1 family)
MFSPIAAGTYAVLGAAGVVGLAAGGYAYASLWPGSAVFGQAMTAPRRAGELALTFDDGPNPAWTPKLLDVLAQHNIRATFFMLGGRAQSQVALVNRVVEAGHLIGNHSWSHPNLARTATSLVREELTRTKDVLEQITGKPVKYFRPPFGARRPVVFKIARELGMTVVTWNAMTSDWSEPSGGRIADALMKKIDRLHARGNAANIVLHDGGHREPEAARGASVAAVGLLAERYDRTHRFVTLDQWVAG